MCVAWNSLENAPRVCPSSLRSDSTLRILPRCTKMAFRSSTPNPHTLIKYCFTYVYVYVYVQWNRWIARACHRQLIHIYTAWYDGDGARTTYRVRVREPTRPKVAVAKRTRALIRFSLLVQGERCRCHRRTTSARELSRMAAGTRPSAIFSSLGSVRRPRPHHRPRHHSYTTPLLTEGQIRTSSTILRRERERGEGREREWAGIKFLFNILHTASAIYYL